MHEIKIEISATSIKNVKREINIIRIVNQIVSGYEEMNENECGEGNEQK